MPDMAIRAVLLLLSVCFFVSASALRQEREAYLIQDPYNRDIKTLVVVSRVESEDGQESATSCEIIKGNGPIEDFLTMSPVRVDVREPDPEEMQEIWNECNAFSLRRRKRNPADNDYDVDDKKSYAGDDSATQDDAVSHGVPGFNLIFPGTKWCGNGDIARKFDDLGFHQDTDRCCRSHDLCEDTMAGGETKNNLTNKSPFTALSCKCDHDFYDCLDRVNTLTSNTVGNSYFNVLKRPCYALDYPPTKKCKKYKTFLKLICVEYQKDTSSKKVYQWIPARHYKKLPIPGPLTVTIPG